jgi:hypothetical protein
VTLIPEGNILASEAYAEVTKRSGKLENSPDFFASAKVRASSLTRAL